MSPSLLPALLVGRGHNRVAAITAMIILCEENDIDVVHESRLDVAVNEEVGENGPHTLDCSTAGLSERGQAFEQT